MIGSTLGPYKILAKIGEGGMGEVYRAHDPQLDREVAIKVLPQHQLATGDARARFEREAKAVAALSHPNILAIHGFGEEGDVAYAVTELLEGATLFEQLQNGPLPLRRALELAAEMADGLAAAHDKGIVHRDLKPANIFLTQDGRLKILDFGLAKATTTPGADALGATLGATVGATVGESTTPGTLLGTVRYMSPEQVRGEGVDHRSDIFSFGTVLWEMLSADAPFERASGVETMNAILNEDLPDPSTLNDSVSVSVDRILQRCLEKSAERRFQSAHDLGFALRTASDSSSRSSIQALPPMASKRRLAPVLTTIGALLAGIVLGGFLMNRLQTPTIPEPVKVIPLTHTGRDWAPSASPDGQMIAFTSSRDGTERIWLRQMKGGVEVPLTDDSGYRPRFSPDGSSVLYLHDEGRVRSAYWLPVVGGLPRKLIENVFEATWSPDGTKIAFVRGQGENGVTGTVLGVQDVRGGNTSILRDFQNQNVYGLDWSPDGNWLVMVGSSSVQNSRSNKVLMVDTESGELRVVLDRPLRFSSPCWTPDGKSILVAQSTSLLGDMASPVGRLLQLDPDSGKERALLWVQSVYAGGGDFVILSTLPDGSLAFDEIAWRSTLTEIQLDGEAPHREGRRLTTGNGRDRQPAYSPDGSKIIFSSNRSGNLDLWILEVDSGQLRQLTDDGADDWDPAFTVDGESVLWSSNRSGPLEVWTARIDGTGARQVTQDGEDAENPTQTPDGEWILFSSASPGRNGVWKIRSDGSEEIRIASGGLLLPEVSPDSRYVSYVAADIQSNSNLLHVSDIETHEVVFTASLPFTGLQSVVQPGRSRWMPDGKTLVFVGISESDRRALFAQDFVPGENTDDTRRLLIELETEEDIESFGISADGSAITVSRVDHFRTLKLAEKLVPVDAGR